MRMPSRKRHAERCWRAALRAATASPAAEMLEGRMLLSGLGTESQDLAQAGTIAYEPAVLPHVIFGTDDRTRVTDTNAFPYSAIGRVSVKFPDGTRQHGTGTMVSAFHILTAGHVVYSSSHGGWATEISVALARDGTELPYGPEASFAFHRSSVEWMSSGDTNHDWALITLDRSLGNFSGWFGVEVQPTAAYAGMAVRTAGYPQDKGGTQMYEASGAVTSATTYDLRYNGTMDTSGGMSGGPVYRVVDGAPIINGIHAYGYTDLGYNSATRITSQKFNDLQAWIGEDMASRVPVDKPDLLDYDGWFGTSFSSFSPAAVLRGGNVQISARVGNLGTADAGSYTLSIYASADSSITAADYPVATATLTTAAMGSMQFNWSGPLPLSIPAGQYYIGWVIDSGNAVGEFKEDNNTGVIAGSKLTVNAAEPDRFEPNDSLFAAANLGSFTTLSEAGLTIHAPGNADYYRFIPAADGQLTAKITFLNAQGNLDLELYNSSFVLIGSSATAGNVESITQSVAAGQVYYLKVFGAGSATSPNYDLAFTMGLGADAREPNDSFAQAADLGTITSANLTGLNIHAAGNEDFFSFIAGTTGPMTATLSFTHALGDIDLRVYNAQEVYVDGSTGVTDTEVVHAGVVAGQKYYLRVSPIGVEVNPNYSLSIGIVEQIPADRFEPNDSEATATNFGAIMSVSEAGLTIHEPGERDYYRFSPAVSGMLNVDVLFKHAFGDVDIYLYDALGVELAASLTASDAEHIGREVVAGQVYHLMVEVCNGGTSPDYTLNLSLLAGASEIRGVKFLDRNANGAQDAGEPPLPDRTIYLDDNRNGGLDAGERSVLTNAQGEYSFTSLVEGTYYVGEVVPEGWIQVFPGAGNLAFDIDLRFMDDGLTASQRAVFQAAAARWSQIIVADLPQILTMQGLVDDLLIDITAPAIDGPGGVLGQAGPRELRDDTSLPAYGEMEFDLADIANLELSGQLLDVVLHEMGHVLGFGTIWSELGLITGAGTADPRYTGAAALAEYNAFFGLSETSIPLENTGGEGTADAHWRESILGDELMTGFIDSVNPLSRISVASMADLGYGVNMSAADLYSAESAAWGGAFTLLQPWASTAEASSDYRVPNTHVIALSAGQVRSGVSFAAFPTAFAGSPDADVWRVRLGDDGLTLGIWESSGIGGAPSFSIDLRLLPSLSFAGLGGDDQLTVDFAGGSPAPAGGIHFDAGTAGALGDRLIIRGSASADTIDIANALVMVNGAEISFDGAAKVELDALGGLDAVSVSGSASVTFAASQDLASLELLGSATATLAAGSGQVLVTRGLILDPGATLDLADNDLVVRVDEPARQAMFDMLRGAILSARNAQMPDLWMGQGITSSVARSNAATGLALAINGTLLAELNGVSLESTDLLVRHTYNGDSNLDGRIGGEDYFALDLAFLTGGQAADVNWDGQIDGDDYFMVDQAFLGQIAVLSASSPSPGAQGEGSSSESAVVRVQTLTPTLSRYSGRGNNAAFKLPESMERSVSPTYTLLHDRDAVGIGLRSEPPADC